MSIHYDIQILRSKLIAMTRLTQRTVDYSIKAMQLGRPELCRVVQNSRDEMNAVHCWIATHGRKLLDAGISGNDSRFACAALRISTALEAAYNAAVEIAEQSQTRFTTGWAPVSAELEYAGQFVNSLLRLCVLSLLNRDIRHARAVLHNAGTGQSLDLAVYLTHRQWTQRTTAQARFEFAIIRSLDAIAGQTREFADSIILWLEEAGHGVAAGKSAIRKPAHVAVSGAFAVNVPAANSRSAMIASGVTPSCTAQRAKLFEDDSVSLHSVIEAAPADEFNQARLMGLQQRVCELLVKNQQLRMALMAERADVRPDQLC
jgi:hypothetical protein